MQLCHDLEQYNSEAGHLPILEELEKAFSTQVKNQVDLEARLGPTTQAYREGQRKEEILAPEVIDQRDESEDDPKDLDKKVPWPIPFPDNEEHQKV